jgi:hypothetical protein
MSLTVFEMENVAGSERCEKKSNKKGCLVYDKLGHVVSRRFPIRTRGGSFHKVHIYLHFRVPQCQSPRPNWEPPPARECVHPPSPGTQGRGDSDPGHTRLRVRRWGSQFRRLEKSQGLYLLCGSFPLGKTNAMQREHL